MITIMTISTVMGAIMGMIMLTVIVTGTATYRTRSGLRLQSPQR